MLFLDLLHDCELEGIIVYIIPSNSQVSFGIFMYISYIADDIPVKVSLVQILSFFTGTEYPPPGGFQVPASINFNPTSEFPLASTCAIQLTLPTQHYDNPERFFERMVYGIANHGRFGLL